MIPLVSQRRLETEVWRTIKLERIEEDPQRRPLALFSRVSSSLSANFARLSYVWFLFISVLEFVHGESDFRMFVPFLALLLLNTAMARYQSRKRAQTKAKQDQTEFEVWTGALVDSTLAKDIKAGDILVLKSGEHCPADILILASGRPDHTALVDCFPYFGTPKVKCKTAISETQRIVKSTQRTEALSRLRRLRGTVRVTQPLADIGQFRGHIKLSGYPTASPVSTESLVLKGCRFCYTPWVIGLVVYAGEDCKVEMNRSSTLRKKWSRLEPLLNSFLACYAAAVVLVSVVCTTVQRAMSGPRENTLLLLRTHLLLFAQAVPASLYLILDLARVTQMLFFCAEADNEGGRLWPHNLRLVETLGQVEYVLTDKTGTLTENEIKLKIVRVGDKDYTRCGLDQHIHRHLCLANAATETRDFLGRSTTTETAYITREDDDTCGFTELRSLVLHSRASIQTRFCECMTLCNVVEVTPGQEFFSQSRQELALICGAVELGVTVHEKTAAFCTLTIGDLRKDYAVLAVVDFKPSLRRMRVLVQQQDSGEGLLIVKGAADVMKTIMALEDEDTDVLDRKVLELAHKRINLFVYATKIFSAAETAAIMEKLDIMQRSESNARKLEGLFKELEKDSMYMGLVGLEDPILPETTAAVSKLLNSGVKMWILSGDRESSTLAAAMEVGLLKPRVHVVSLCELEHTALCKPTMAQAVRKYILQESISESGTPFRDSQGERPSDPPAPGFLLERGTGEPVLQRRSVMYAGKPSLLDVPFFEMVSDFAISIDGVSFRTALAVEETRRLLAALLHSAQAVFFHSMLPHQKALAARFVRENFSHKPVVLAVGDETNDISMIQEADVGVVVRRANNREVGGISDLEIASFADLSHLVLTQGKEAYRNVAALVRLWVYANTLPVALTVWYAYFCGFTATAILPAVLWTLHILFSGVLVLIVTLRETASHEGSASPVKTWSLCREIGMALAHASLIFLFVFTSTDSTAAYDSLTARSFLCVTFATVLHIIVSAEQLSALAIPAAVILCGTLIFTLQTVLETTGDAFVLVSLLSTPVPVLGEVGAVVSCAALSLALEARSAFRQPAEKDASQATTARTRRGETGGTLAKVYRDTADWKQKPSNYTMHAKWLRFASSILEAEYMREVLLVSLKKMPVMLFSAALCVYVVYRATVQSFFLGQVILYFFAMLFLCTAPFMHLEIVTSLQFMLLCGKLAVELEYAYTDVLSFLLPVSYSLFVIVDWRHNVVLLGWNLLTVFCTVFSFGTSSSDMTFTAVLMSLFSLSLFVFNYLNEKESRTEFLLLKTTKLEVDRAKDILYCLFPSFVLKQVWDRQLPIALDQNLVTVLFCDICDFDRICSELSEQELMDLLDDLFKKLDDMCETYGMSKIETVGKTYLACAGLKERENELSDDLLAKSHARRTCEMAIDVMNLFQEFAVAGRPLRANIGINSGPVIAGVVGSEKPQFALIGDTVNTASRMSSTAPHPSCIQISSETYAQLKNNFAGFTLTPRSVEVKGKGEMFVYLLQENEERFGDLCSPKVPAGRGRRGRKPEGLTLSRKELFGNWRFSTMLDREALAAAMAARTLSGVNSDEGNTFQLGAIERQFQRLHCGFLMILTVAFCEMGLWAVEYSENRAAGIFWSLVAVVVVSVLIKLRFRQVTSLHQFPWFFCVFGLLFSVAVTFSSDYYSTDHWEQTVLVQILLIVYLQAQGGLFLFHSVVFSACLVVYSVGLVGMEENRLERIEAALAVLPALVLSLCFARKKQHDLHVYTSFELNVAEQKKKTDEIILRMMPTHVYESLLDEKHKADPLTDVTIVFADIVGFTALSSRKTPTDMVILLNDLFSGFDAATAQNHVKKVHTIGDCYVAMGYRGVSDGRDRHAECVNVLNLAFDMLTFICEVNQRYPDLGLGMRIGIHTGKITAGIAGAKIVRYDIYGPDVLIANKMESSGTQGRIHVSQVTKELAEKAGDAFAFEPSKEVEVKSLGISVKGFFAERQSS